MRRPNPNISVSIDDLAYLHQIAIHVYPTNSLSLHYSSDPASPPSQCQYFSTSNLDLGRVGPVSFLPCRSENILANFQPNFVHTTGGEFHCD